MHWGWSGKGPVSCILYIAFACFIEGDLLVAVKWVGIALILTSLPVPPILFSPLSSPPLLFALGCPVLYPARGRFFLPLSSEETEEGRRRKKRRRRKEAKLAPAPPPPPPPPPPNVMPMGPHRSSNGFVLLLLLHYSRVSKYEYRRSPKETASASPDGAPFKSRFEGKGEGGTPLLMQASREREV